MPNISVLTNTGKHLATVCMDGGVSTSTAVAPGCVIEEKYNDEKIVHDFDESESSGDYTNCGQVGFWVQGCTPGGELMQWGIDGDTKYPYRSYDAALEQARYLAESECHRKDAFYILNVFPNGQIRLDEVDV